MKSLSESGYLCGNQQTDSKIHTEFQEIWIVKTIKKKKEQRWEIHTSQFQNLWQSNDNQDSVVLAGISDLWSWVHDYPMEKE
jgi:hypothetical protein